MVHAWSGKQRRARTGSPLLCLVLAIGCGGKTGTSETSEGGDDEAPNNIASSSEDPGSTTDSGGPAHDADVELTLGEEQAFEEPQGDLTLVVVPADFPDSDRQDEILISMTDVRLEFNAGCNSYHAEVQYDGQALMIPAEGFRSTLVRCEPGADEVNSWLAQFFRSEPTVRIFEDYVVFEGPDSKLVFARPPESR